MEKFVSHTSLVKGSAGQADIHRFKPNFRHNLLGYSVFLLKYRHLGSHWHQLKDKLAISSTQKWSFLDGAIKKIYYLKLNCLQKCTNLN